MEENEPTIRAGFYRCDVSIRANFHSHQDIIPKKLSAVYIDCVGNNLIDPNKGRLFGALDFRFLLCSTSVLFESQSGVRIDPKLLDRDLREICAGSKYFGLICHEWAGFAPNLPASIMAKKKDAYTVIPVNVEEKEMEEMQPVTDKTDQAEDEMEERFDKEFWLMVRICKIVFVA